MLATEREQVFGVDFSGASTPGGRIWITKGSVTECEGNSDPTLMIESVRSAADRFDVTDRVAVLAELCDFVSERTEAVFGFDFPFGLPHAVLETTDFSTWTEFVEGFKTEFKNEDDDPQKFRQECAKRAGENNPAYVRRETDWQHGGQCPYGNQIQYQTYFGISQLLAPLVTNERITVAPMQCVESGTPVLIETYPAAVFGRLGAYRQGYKNHDGAEDRRERNLTYLETNGSLQICEKCRNRAIASDDALDSLACACGAWRAISTKTVIDPVCSREGWIYI